MTTAMPLRADPAGPVLTQVLERAADPDGWERFERQLRSSGYCRRPVRLRGQTDAIDLATGECRTTFSTASEPDETLLKCCGNRREAVCPSCAEVYRGDAFQLVTAGLRGGKGVPDTVATHPRLFVTLTAPSFGHVHTLRERNGKPQRCRPRRDAPVCPHGVRLSCGEVHDQDDPRLGEPLCLECFDYRGAVIWNALAPELWRRTAIQIPRELARIRGISQRRLHERVRVSYVKVAEYQRRGVLHFHLVIRLDAAQPKERSELVEPPPAEFTAELLAQAVRSAVEHARAPVPQDADELRLAVEDVRWGGQVDVRDLARSAGGAAACAAYIAKYATKSTEAVGGLTHRLAARDLQKLRVRPHVARMVRCAWDLATEPRFRPMRLRRWAHTLAFRGHCFTKSRRYSTTFTALRRARHEHVLARQHGGRRRDPWGRSWRDGQTIEHKRYAFTGTGYRTLGDAWLAESGAARTRERRRVAREELRIGRQGRTEGRESIHDAGRHP
jgi:hypothetical protein